MRRLSWALFMAAGYLLTITLLHATFDRPPKIAGFEEKLSFLESNAHEYSVLHVGSSRVFRHVVPEAFDRAAAEAGIEVRSFNLGVDALSLVEMKSLLKHVAEMPGPGPRYVLIEPALGIGLHPRNTKTIRAAYFRNLRNTAAEIRAHGASPREWPSIFRSLRACLNHYAYVGRLSGALLPPVNGSHGRIPHEHLEAERGFQAQEKSGRERAVGPWRRHLLENFDEIAREVLADEPPHDSLVEDLAPRIEMLMEAVQALREAGIEPLFYISPLMNQDDPLHAFEAYYEEEDPEIPLISYLGRIEELYHPSLWWNPGHMNGDGARIFSHHLGRDFAVWMQRED